MVTSAGLVHLLLTTKSRTATAIIAMTKALRVLGEFRPVRGKGVIDLFVDSSGLRYLDMGSSDRLTPVLAPTSNTVKPGKTSYSK
jgi:hypothetical protein